MNSSTIFRASTLPYFLCLCLLTLISCDKDIAPPEPKPIEPKEECPFTLQELVEAVEPASCTSQFTELHHTEITTSGDQDTNFVTIYTIDNCGKVVQEIHNDFKYGDNSYVSEFRYNDNGEVIKEFRNGVIYRYVEWLENKVNIYNPQCELLGELLFENKKIVQHYIPDDVYYSYKIRLAYDDEGNLISTTNEAHLNAPYEFLEYSSEVENPFYLLRSISILRYPGTILFMQYTHDKEKRNEYTIDHVTYPLRTYNLTYEYDSLGRVNRVENSKDFHFSTFSYQ